MRRLASGWMAALVLASGVVGLLVGLALGGGEPGGADPGVELIDRSVVPPAPMPSPVELRGAPPSSLPHAPGPDAALEEIARAVRRLPVTEVPRGTGVVTGTVQTEEGAPLGGVLVVAQAYRPRDPRTSSRQGRIPDEAEVTAGLRRRVENMLWSHASRVSALTGAGGSYRLEGLLEYDYSVRAYAEGYQLESVQRGRVRPGATVDFTARLVVPVTFRVLLPDGSTPEQATLMLEHKAGGTHRTTHEPWAATNTTVYVRPGPYAVSALSGEAREFRSETTGLTVEATSPTTTVILQLSARLGIRGSVVPPADEESGQFRVYALRTIGDTEVGPERLVNEGQDAWVRGLAGTRSTYSFMDIEPGTYVVGVTRSDHKVVATRTVEVRDGIVDLDLEVPPPDRSDYVVVRATGPGGEALRDLQFRTAWRSESGSSSGGGGNAIRHGDGTFWVPHHDVSGMSSAKGGRYFLTVISPEHGEREIEYTPGPRSEVTVRFSEPGSLEVTITGYVGSGHEGHLDVSVVRADEDVRQFFSGARGRDRLSPEGSRTVSNLEPGEYVVVLYVRVGRHEILPVSRTPVRVGEGANRVSVALPPLHRLTVRTARGSGGSVMLRSAGEDHPFFGLHRAPDDDGTVEFSLLPAGRYKVMHYGDGERKEREVVVPGTSVVTFD